MSRRKCLLGSPVGVHDVDHSRRFVLLAEDGVLFCPSGKRRGLETRVMPAVGSVTFRSGDGVGKCNDSADGGLTTTMSYFYPNDHEGILAVGPGKRLAVQYSSLDERQHDDGWVSVLVRLPGILDFATTTR